MRAKKMSGMMTARAITAPRWTPDLPEAPEVAEDVVDSVEDGGAMADTLVESKNEEEEDDPLSPFEDTPTAELNVTGAADVMAVEVDGLLIVVDGNSVGADAVVPGVE